MTHEPDPSLESLIHRKLKGLPEMDAPAGLVPSVLAKIQARAEKRWWQGAWWTWPIAARLAAIALLLGIMAGIAVILPQLSFELSIPWLDRAFNLIAQIFDLGVTLLDSAFLVLGSINAFLLWGVAAVVAITYVGFIGLGTLLYRLSFAKS